MGSFADAIDYLAQTIGANAALISFCRDAWGRSPLIKKYFKYRTEVSLQDLPVILVTRPSVEKAYRTGTRDGKHVVRLYCGFHQTDREKAQADMIGFEETIDDALSPLGEAQGILMVNPVATVTDEGKFHPVYFFVMDVEVWHRRMGA